MVNGNLSEGYPLRRHQSTDDNNVSNFIRQFGLMQHCCLL